MFMPATKDGGFVDRKSRPGFAPFAIANIDGDILVTYAKQNEDKHDAVATACRRVARSLETFPHVAFGRRSPTPGLVKMDIRSGRKATSYSQNILAT
jgi:hypothetical protein